jgi:hypothetical protein
MARQYKTGLLVILTGVIALSAAGGTIAAGPETQEGAGPTQASEPGGVPTPTPMDLWKQIEELRKTNAIMAQSNPIPAQLPFHGMSHPFQLGSRTVDWYTIDFANKPVNDAINAAGKIVKVTEYPPGSLMVKANYTKDKKLTGITAMLKLAGYDPADRNWLMAAYSPAGKEVSYGKVPACIACHNLVRSADFNFAPPPDQLLPVAIWNAFFPKQSVSPAYLKLLKEHPEAIVKSAP